MSQYQAVKGTKDIFPEEVAQWKYVEGIGGTKTERTGFG